MAWFEKKTADSYTTTDYTAPVDYSTLRVTGTVGDVTSVGTTTTTSPGGGLPVTSGRVLPSFIAGEQVAKQAAMAAFVFLWKAMKEAHKNGADLKELGSIYASKFKEISELVMSENGVERSKADHDELIKKLTDSAILSAPATYAPPPSTPAHRSEFKRLMEEHSKEVSRREEEKAMKMRMLDEVAFRRKGFKT